MSLPDPKSLLLSALGFIIVLLILRKFLFQAAAEVLAARQNEVETYYSAAEDDRKAAEELKTQYESHMAGVAEEMRTKINDAIKQGQAMREEIIADSRTKSEEVLQKAQDEIRREKEKALTELKTTVADLAVNAAGKLIEEKLDPAKHRQMVSKYIDSLDEVPK